MIKKILDCLYIVEKLIAIISIGLMSAFVIIDIGSREIFSTGIPGAQKLAVYLMIWAGFLGASLTAHKGTHLRPEIADGLWPKKLLPVFHRLRHFLTGVFSIFFAYYGYLYVIESMELGDVSPVLNISIWIVQIIIPMTFILISIKSFVFSFCTNLMPPTTRGQH